MNDPWKNLGDYMIAKGYASPEQIREARKMQQTTNGDLAQILIGMGLNPRDVYEAKAQEMQVPFVDLTVYKPDSSAISAVPEHVARRHNVMPIKKDGNTLYVAMSDLNNITANDDIRLVSRCVVRGVLAVPEHIKDAISRLYGRTTVEGAGDKAIANGDDGGLPESMAGFIAERAEEKGRAKEAARALETVLTVRFGNVPPEIKERIEAADLPTLRTWLSKAIKSDTLGDALL